MFKLKLFPILFLVLISLLNGYNCDKETNEIDPKCCANVTNQRIVVEFSSNVVSHEFIVQFTNYYQKEARRKFLTAAFDNNDVCTHYLSTKTYFDNEFFDVFNLIDYKLDHNREIKSSKRLSE
jgi:hypothetical protein